MDWSKAATNHAGADSNTAVEPDNGAEATNAPPDDRSHVANPRGSNAPGGSHRTTQPDRDDWADHAPEGN